MQGIVKVIAGAFPKLNALRMWTIKTFLIRAIIHAVVLVWVVYVYVRYSAA